MGSSPRPGVIVLNSGSLLLGVSLLLVIMQILPNEVGKGGGRGDMPLLATEFFLCTEVYFIDIHIPV